MSEIVGKMKKSIKFALRQPGQAVASVINRLTVEPDVFDNKLGIVVIIKNEGHISKNGSGIICLLGRI